MEIQSIKMRQISQSFPGEADRAHASPHRGETLRLPHLRHQNGKVDTNTNINANMIRNTHKIQIQMQTRLEIPLSQHDLRDQDGKVVNNEHEYKNVPDRSKLKVQTLLKNGTIFSFNYYLQAG